MQCPFCKEEIIDGAIKCKHCGSMLGGVGQTKVKWAMEGWQAFIIAIVLFIILCMMNNYLAMAVILLTSIWASMDAGKINAKRFKSKFMKASPAMVFFGCLMLWIVSFPWYLYFRSQILAGRIGLRSGFETDSNNSIDPSYDSLNK